MNFIIFDLEWNQVFQKKKLISHEITEIGAVEVSNVDGMLILGRTFHSFVRPIYPVTKRIRKLTNLKKPDTWLAPRLPLVINNFERWLGNHSYIFCSWGEDDRRVFLENLYFHDLNPSRYKHYYDIQSNFANTLENKSSNQIGLLKAMEMLNLTFEGEHHRAVDDALNTARVFIKVHKQLNINPEPFVNNLLEDNEYTSAVRKIRKIRKSLKMNYSKLAEISQIAQEDLKQIESFQLTKNKKEIIRLKDLLYSLRDESLRRK